jgi:Transposase DDE domain group 1
VVGVKQKTSAPFHAWSETECRQVSFQFQDLGSRQVIADFGGGFLSSDGGALLLRQVDRAVGLSRALASCFVDQRDDRFVEHGVAELVAQRLYALALGYEDLNDHADLRRDPLLAVAANKPDPLGTGRRRSDRGRALAAPATLQRMESAVDHPGSRYHKLAAPPAALRALLLQQGVRTLAKATREVIVDFDATDARLHGQQEGRFFHGYYGDYCYLPLLAFIGEVPVWSELRTADGDAARGTVVALAEIVAAVRRRCPHAQITVRGDSGFCREELMAWCEAHGVGYVLGLARNARLLELLTPALGRARERAVHCGGHTREFADLRYRTLDSWSRERRVIGKAEILGDKDNPRFIVTNRPAETHGAAPLYEEVYCGRGEMENAIKEHQLDLFGERLSCHGFASNEVRLLLASFAQLLLARLRAIGLAGTTLARATAGTIRLHLLKLAAQVTVTVRRVHIRFASAFARQAEFAQAHAQLAAWVDPG